VLLKPLANAEIRYAGEIARSSLLEILLVNNLYFESCLPYKITKAFINYVLIRELL